MESSDDRSFMEMIGLRIKKAREERELSRFDVAKGLGVTEATIGYHERGENRPDSRIDEYAAFFGVSRDFFTETEECSMAPQQPLPRRRSRQGGPEISAVREYGQDEFWHIPSAVTKHFLHAATASKLTIACALTDDLLDFGVKRGDYIIIDRDRTHLMDGGIYAFEDEGTLRFAPAERRTAAGENAQTFGRVVAHLRSEPFQPCEMISKVTEV